MLDHMRAIPARPVSFVLALLTAAAARVGAQGPPAMTSPSTPTIAATARGETQVTPDRATVHIGVETRGPTAAAAARANADRQTQVLTAIKAAGIPDSQIRTVGFNVFPEYAHEPNREPRVTGYRVTNTVVVDVRDIAQVGRILDSALKASANRINAIEFYSSRVDEARRDALARAVEKARLAAEAMARAAGGSLGPLAELTSVEHDSGPRPMADFAVRAQAGAASTPIEPGEYTVSASVTARWQFVPGR
jgi:hypothetical protein